MPKYTISYYFDGNGEVEIEAKDKAEAEEKWRNGEFDAENETEWGENYEVDEVDEISQGDIGFKI